jgi:phosphoglycerol transferase MdoB-like AlkP superfamily enzyme
LRLLALPFLFFGMLVVARGGIDGKPISVGEAFFSNTPAQGYLALNGAFAVSRALLEDPPALREFMPAAQARTMVQSVLAGNGAVFSDPDYPLYRSDLPATRANKPNVVVLMLESWGAQHIDALRLAKNETPLGVTPHFDALARTGRLYSRFYANGQRSIQGAEAILASQPTFPGMPFLGEGIEQNRQSFMGELARSQGYETFFLQSSEHGSLRFDAISARAGFGTYRGAEDIANLHETPKPAATWGTWDHNTLQAAHQLFAAARKPFLGFVFTSTTHTPWLIPDARFEKFKGKSDKELFLNTLYYADWALGELIAAAKKAGYYDNTIFVLVADHADEFVSDSSHIPNLYNVPLLIVGPGIQPGMDARIGSQFDILPTLVDVCGWQTPYAGMGRSLLDNSRLDARASLGVRGSELDWITSAGWVSHNLDRPLGQSAGLSAALAEQLTQQLLAAYQTASHAQSHNKIMPSPR